MTTADSRMAQLGDLELSGDLANGRAVGSTQRGRVVRYATGHESLVF